MIQQDNWDSYRRKQVNIRKSISNVVVSQLLTQHYRYLHSKLVKYPEDEDTFNDTYLKLTYNYNPEEDFIDQYCYYFNLLQGAYYRDDKVTNYLLQSVEDNTVELPDIIEEEPVETKVQTEDSFLNDLISGINADTKKAK